MANDTHDTAIAITKRIEAKALELHHGAKLGKPHWERLEVAGGYLLEEATWIREQFGITPSELPWPNTAD
jgi:hypothetical protein